MDLMTASSEVPAPGNLLIELRHICDAA